MQNIHRSEIDRYKSAGREASVQHGLPLLVLLESHALEHFVGNPERLGSFPFREAALVERLIVLRKNACRMHFRTFDRRASHRASYEQCTRHWKES